MAYLNPNSFYNHYQAPRSSAFGGTLGPKPKPKAKTPSTNPAPASPVTTGAPQGFTVTPLNLPPDAVYQQTLGGLGRTLTDTLGGLTNDRSAGLSQYGFTEDPTTHAIAYDPNNPYSQASLLRKNYQQAKTGNTTSYAASGQLYAGSLQNAQDKATGDYNASESGLEGAVQRFLANNTQAANTARDTYDTNAGLALGTSVQNAPNNPLYNPSASASGGIYSVDANGNAAITAGAGGTALVPQQPNSRVKLASGFTLVTDAAGKPLYILDPQGNRLGG